jgi:hypothetical protein
LMNESNKLSHPFFDRSQRKKDLLMGISIGYQPRLRRSSETFRSE